jgi:hypothetical protein
MYRKNISSLLRNKRNAYHRNITVDSMNEISDGYYEMFIDNLNIEYLNEDKARAVLRIIHLFETDLLNEIKEEE